MLCYMCIYILDIDNLVSLFYLFLFFILKVWAQLDVGFYGLNLFFHPQITSACKNNTSPVNRKSTD